MTYSSQYFQIRHILDLTLDQLPDKHLSLLLLFRDSLSIFFADQIKPLQLTRRSPPFTRMEKFEL